MPDTYSQLNIHAVFSVHGRENLLNARIRNVLFPYISGIIKKCGNYPIIVGGYRDHVHIFFELNPVNNISDVMKKVKANSSKWINDNAFLPGTFRWQNGYAAFSYSRSQRSNVIEYIKSQEDHHKKVSFKEEYLQFLKMFEVEYDNRYVFAFYS
jgi:REP element-mobilizing transposase RayT